MILFRFLPKSWKSDGDFDWKWKWSVSISYLREVWSQRKWEVLLSSVQINMILRNIELAEFRYGFRILYSYEITFKRKFDIFKTINRTWIMKKITVSGNTVSRMDRQLSVATNTLHVSAVVISWIFDCRIFNYKCLKFCRCYNHENIFSRKKLIKILRKISSNILIAAFVILHMKKRLEMNYSVHHDDEFEGVLYDTSRSGSSLGLFLWAWFKIITSITKQIERFFSTSNLYIPSSLSMS